MDNKSKVKNNDMNEIIDKLEQGVKDVFTSEKYKNYLTVMSKFHSYSYRNSLMIFLQKPTATYVAGFNKWNDFFKRSVNKGEKGIQILAPIQRKEQYFVSKLDPTTDKEILDKNGKPVKEVLERTKTSFKLVHVFDISQTSGENLPTLSSELSGSVNEYKALFSSIKEITPFPIEFKELPGETKGECNLTNKKIYIQIGMSEAQTIKTLIHELAHAILHSKPEDKDIPKSREQKEVEAESIAFITCSNYGIDTSDYSFPYIASWGNKELNELKNSLETIQKESSNIIKEIDKNFYNLSKHPELLEPNIFPESSKATENNIASFDFIPSKEPIVIINSSHHKEIASGKRLTLFEADRLFKALDKVEYDTKGTGFSKHRVDFTIKYLENDKTQMYKGKYIFGDGEIGLMNHLNQVVKFELSYPFKIDTGEVAPKGRNFEYVSQTLIPYLTMHNNISSIESIIKEVLADIKNGDSHIPNIEERINYYNDYLQYIDNLRDSLNNNSEINVSPPNLDDYLPVNNLEDFELNLEKEIKEEAASFGVSLEDYINSDYQAPERTFTIYQLQRGIQNNFRRYESYNDSDKPSMVNYNSVYTGKVDSTVTLNNIYQEFNINKPDDCKGKNLSVSDIIVIESNGKYTANYVNPLSYVNCPEFAFEHEKKILNKSMSIQERMQAAKEESSKQPTCYQNLSVEKGAR